MSVLRWPATPKPLVWITLLTSAVVVWVGAAVLGFLTVKLAGLLPERWSGSALMLGGIGLFLLFSPLYSWAGFLIALPLEYWLAKRQLFGWGAALALGTAIGAALVPILDTALPLFLGGPLLLLQWLVIVVVENGRPRTAPPSRSPPPNSP